MRRDTKDPVLTLPDGTQTPVSIRRSTRARHILLHVGTGDGKVELVLPPGATIREGMSFARSKTGWLMRQFNELGDAIPFADGAAFPMLGDTITIRRTESRSALPVLDEGELLVGGRDDTLAGRVRRWVRNRALAEIEPRAHVMAAELGRTPKRIAVRDTRSRWGSCSPDGNLNFSWRLIFAPENVFDYVIAHEVAHLRELNHGPRFWAHVEALCPDYAPSRRWLRTYGAKLHRYGREE